MNYPKYIDEILEKLKNVKSNFFTIDVAKKSDGEWIVMELGDGQVSGLQDYEINKFYVDLITLL